MYRTNNCNELSKKDLNKKVMLSGWVQTRRDHGGVIFIDLRDKYGITQIVFDPKDKELFSEAHKLRREFVIQIEGKVRNRPDGTINKNLKTGEIEVDCNSLKIISKSDVPPIEIEENITAAEDVRLTYRYLDLRRSKMQKNLKLRHDFILATRNFFDKKGFTEIETPILMKPTPEGARDYLVPSRVHKGKFYALPQSPQIYKQLCMIAGLDKYFQIARCFRDEDLRADRQPEFTQLDLEMSFINQEEIFNLFEEWLKESFQKIINVKLKTPFKRMSHKEAMEKYGTDKPDLRFSLELQDVTKIFKDSEFKVFKQEKIKAIAVDKDIPRKEIDDLTEFCINNGAKGLAWIKYTDNKIDSTIAKFFSEEEKKDLIKELKLKDNSTVFFISDEEPVVNEVLSKLRLELGKRLNLIKDEFNFLWITEFPLFTWNKEENKFDPEHHPFTGIHPDDENLLNNKKDLGKVRSTSYDLVLNGIELGSGSIRIHDSNIQKKIFNLLGINEEDAKDRFGFFIDALKYGTPPHGGFAVGFDRLIMLIAKEDSIREVIAFPKNKVAESPMDGSPSHTDEKALKDLGIKIEKKK